jgi:hypothetical protein
MTVTSVVESRNQGSGTTRNPRIISYMALSSADSSDMRVVVVKYDAGALRPATNPCSALVSDLARQSHSAC